jgi:transposase-like protein
MAEPQDVQRKHIYTLEEKKKIVAEAYSLPRHIRPTAAYYKVQPGQIRQWKRTIDTCARLGAGQHEDKVKVRHLT